MSNQTEPFLLIAEDVLSPSGVLDLGLINERIHAAYWAGHYDGYRESAGPKAVQPDPESMRTPEDTSSYRPAGTIPLTF